MEQRDFGTYTARVVGQYEGTGILPPHNVLCPECGAIVYGAADNIALHIRWHAALLSLGAVTDAIQRAARNR